jgi:hypothetical protein
MIDRVNAGSENDGNFAPGGSGISVSLRGIRGCGWALVWSWFSWGRGWGIGGSIELADTVQISKPIVQIIFELGLKIFGVIPSLSQPSVKVD